MFAKFSWLCLLIAVGLLVWSGFCVVHSNDSRHDGDGLNVEYREQDLGEQTLGAHTLGLRIRNTSSQPRRILGVTGH